MTFKKVLLIAGLTAALFPAAALAQTVDERALKNRDTFTRQPVTAADTQSYSGTNVGGPEWVRPFADGTCCSSLGPVRYTVQAFTVGANGAYNISSVQTGGWDGYILVYRDAFNPLSQSANFVAGDDDGDGGIGTSDIDGVVLNIGVTYFLVTTGFENMQEGAFTNEVAGPGAVHFAASVPTMGEWALLILMLALLGVGGSMLRRREVTVNA